MFVSLFRKLQELDYRAKSIILFVLEFCIFTFVVYVSFFARMSNFILPDGRINLSLILAPIFSVIALAFTDRYRSATRYHSAEIELKYVVTLSVAPVFWGFCILGLGAEGFPRSIILIYWAMSIVAFVAWRRGLAALISIVDNGGFKRGDRRTVLILGAGPVGVQIYQGLYNQGTYRPVAFLDDDPSLKRRRVLGLRVHPVADAARLIRKYGVRELLIANPDMRPMERREFVRSLQGLTVAVKTVPSVSDLASGRWKISELRDIQIEELLGREPVKPSPELISRSVRGKSVLVTGAGGSIGSELARQIAREAPGKLILMELSEFGLFDIGRKLRAATALAKDSFEIVSVLGSVLDQALVERVLAEHRVETVFHAAAYKHVGLVEANPAAAVLNNVFGTLCLCQCAIKAGVGLFVLISTDKAVRPTSVMGSTKRVAELIMQAAADEHSGTVFTMVRFGNVLGSSGSVVPIFQEQIRRGGPVTVTDPEVTRFFMLIPEAAQLVIQAGGLAKGGEIYLLDMGTPVKIAELAKTMINLSGYDVYDEATKAGDIQIVYTGLQSGEKLYEELLVDASVEYTAHPLIYRGAQSFLPFERLNQHLAGLKTAAQTHDEGAMRTILAQLAVDNVAK